ncbi:MAG: hypothetical protein P8X42_12900 [Calditrichaceae bacterium]|jgi:ABC-type phosphate transport system substrate-binding protein
MKFIIKLILPLIFLCGFAYSQVAIIANKSVPLNDIDKNQLMDYYSKDIKFWENGEPVILFNLKVKNKAHENFYKFLGKSSSRMKSVWLKKMLLGEGEPPEALNSEEEMLRKIINTPGSIGFINPDMVSEKVKLLKIIKNED